MYQGLGQMLTKCLQHHQGCPETPKSADVICERPLSMNLPRSKTSKKIAKKLWRVLPWLKQILIWVCILQCSAPIRHTINCAALWGTYVHNVQTVSATWAVCFCDWLSWLTWVPADQSQAADSLGAESQSDGAQTQNIVSTFGHQGFSSKKFPSITFIIALCSNLIERRIQIFYLNHTKKSIFHKLSV